MLDRDRPILDFMVSKENLHAFLLFHFMKVEIELSFPEFLEDGNTEKNQFKGAKMCRGVTSERGFPHLNACITAHSHIESYLAYKKYDLQTKGIL